MAGFELQAGRFRQVEQQIHVLHGLPTCSLQQIIDHGVYHQFAAYFLQLNQGFVGIDDLL